MWLTFGLSPVLICSPVEDPGEVLDVVGVEVAPLQALSGIFLDDVLYHLEDKVMGCSCLAVQVDTTIGYHCKIDSVEQSMGII